MTDAEYVRAVRAELGDARPISQDKLALLTGIPRSTIAHLEAQDPRCTLRVSQVQKLREVCPSIACPCCGTQGGDGKQVETAVRERIAIRLEGLARQVRG